VPYRNKLYIAFDGDEDMEYYRTLQMWKANQYIDFDFYNAHDLNTARDTSLPDSIKAQLRDRMVNSKVVLLLVGQRTKFLRLFVPYEVKLARRLDIPVVVANLNKKRGYDANRCPSAVTDNPVSTVHVSFESRIIKHALNYFPNEYRSMKLAPSSTLEYPASDYRQVGL
jgi:MTH538 TIR-like domain (DUF1863)